MNQNCFYLCLLKSRWHRLSGLYKLSLEPRLMWGQTDMHRTEQKNHRLQIASTEYLTWTQFLCLYLLNMSDMKRFFSCSFSLRLFSGMSNENHVFIFISRYQRLTPRRKNGFQKLVVFFWLSDFSRESSFMRTFLYVNKKHCKQNNAINQIFKGTWSGLSLFRYSTLSGFPR